MSDGSGYDLVGDLGTADSVFEVVEDSAADLRDEDLPSTDLDAGHGEAEVTDVAWQPPFDPAACGMEPYQWLEPASMGQIVLQEELLMSNLTPETIDGFMEQLDLEGLPPAKYGVRNFRIRYTTQDRGQPVDATATVGIPWGDDVPWPAPIMLWLHGSNGFMDDCALSADPMMGAAPGALWSAQGYVVVAPDYLGQLGMGEPSPPGTIHPYLVGEATAIASLDSVRAAVRLLEQEEDDIVGSVDPAKVAIMGGSQGGHAAMFCDRYQPHYAPELEVVGVVAATSPNDLLGEGAQSMSELTGSSATFMFALVAMKNWYGAPEDLFGLFTNEEPFFIAEKIESYMSDACAAPIDTSTIDELSDVFLPAVIEHAASGDWEAIPPWGCYLGTNSIPGTPIPRVGDAPILTVYSGEDELIDNGIEQANWPAICAEGYQLEYLECAGLGHAAGAVASVPYALSWLQDRLDGQPLDPAVVCKLQEAKDCSTL